MNVRYDIEGASCLPEKRVFCGAIRAVPLRFRKESLYLLFHSFLSPTKMIRDKVALDK